MRARLSTLLTTLVLLLFVRAVPGLSAQGPLDGQLEGVGHIRCGFSLMTLGNWEDATPLAEVQDADLELEFVEIIADEGSAQMASGFGNYDIIVRYVPGYLHFIQSFLDGPLHVTTVLEKESSDGRAKAMHSRHEFTDFALPGFTSSPEQYYGECEVID